jgi:hypothetical protein
MIDASVALCRQARFPPWGLSPETHQRASPELPGLGPGKRVLVKTSAEC